MLDNPLELLRVTEATAIAASQWIGTGDKLGADKAATEAMRERFNRIEFAGKIEIGEGKKDKSFGLFAGECVGTLGGRPGVSPYGLAVDPIDGTRPTVTSGPEALSVLAIAEANALFTTEEVYMNKIAYGPEVAAKGTLHLLDPLPKIIDRISAVTQKPPSGIVVCLLDRPRHEKIIAQLRQLGVRIKLIQDCDISGAIATCLPRSGIDLLYGIGGSPEGIITACAMKCLRGGFEGQVVKPDGTPADSKVYSINDLVRSHCAFAATGITDGSLLKGVRFTPRGPLTHSVVMRSKTGTVRWVTAQHGGNESPKRM